MFSASSGYKTIFDHVIVVNIVGDIKYVIIFQCFIIVDILTHNLPCVISWFLNATNLLCIIRRPFEFTETMKTKVAKYFYVVFVLIIFSHEITFFIQMLKVTYGHDLLSFDNAQQFDFKKKIPTLKKST